MNIYSIESSVTELERSSLPVKLTFFCGYPALSVLFLGLGLGDLWNLWAMIIAGGVILTVGSITLRPIVENPSLIEASVIFYLWAWLFSLVLYTGVLAGDLAYAGLGLILNGLVFYLVVTLLDKRNLLSKLGDPRRSGLQALNWFLLISSASVPTSLGLTRLHSMINLFPIIAFGMVFGWLGPEVIPRVISGRGKPFVLLGAHMFLLIFLYWISETVNPALKYLTLDLVDVWILSYVACLAMLVSRCTLEAKKFPAFHAERVRRTKKLAQLIKMEARSSFVIYKTSGMETKRYSLLFLEDRMVFVAIGSRLEEELRESPIGEKAEGFGEVSVGELVKMNEDAFEILYKDIERIEIREATTNLVERAFRAGVLIIEDGKKHRFDIAPELNFEECEEKVRSVLSGKPIKLDI